jgi:signal transduction histidine kinase
VNVIVRQGLFFKIFSWFWLIVMLTGTALEATAAWERRTTASYRARFEKLLPEAARAAANNLDTSGESGLASYLSHFQKTHMMTAFFFDVQGGEVTHRRVPPAVRKEGLLALLEPGVHRSGGNGEIASLHVTGSSGQNYAMVFVLPSGPGNWYWNMPMYWRLTVLFLISGVFCFLIARHVAQPLLHLQAAAAGIAEGHLETRVSTDLQRRGDEIAGLAKDFNRMASRIEALVHGHKQLLANVSHELRSPLSRMLLALSLSKRASQEHIGEHLERIGIEARRLDRLIGQLLTLSRVESTADEGHRTSVDLTTLVQEVASDADFEARARRCKVDVVVTPGCVTIGNEELLRSALENVLRNAVRYTAEGTGVEVSLRREGARAVIRVRDHGPGVPAGMLRSIFVPFQKAENSTEGSGLGLAIAERAVVAHLGSIRASNAEGGGLVVDVDLPLAP